MNPAQMRWVNYPGSKLIKTVTLEIGTPLDDVYQKEIYVKCGKCDVVVSASDVNENMMCKKCLQKQRVS